tara:strand:+ start:534 stop:2783 length:2250 start_codon:yes stop_codon:yes gene_type:complete
VNSKKILLLLFCIVFIIFFSDNPQPKNLNNQDSIQPYCNGLPFEIASKLTSNDLEIIEIETPDSRGWYENLYKAEITGNYINSKFKKYFDANITFKFKNDINCTSQAEVRIHGDFKDHIIPPFTSSLDVKLVNDNIFGITKFKLFIPQTRSIGKYEDFGTNSETAADGEIFGSVVMRSLGFLSPRTFYVQASVNSGISSRFLFQEKITKEFIESNNYREGPILETNEKYIWEDSADNNYVRTNPQDGKFALEFGKILNRNWALRSFENFIISLEALEKYNKAIFNTNTWRELNNKMLGQNYENIYKFEASLWALRGAHGVENTHNRKFFFNKLNNEFIPIVYDTNIQFFFADEPQLIAEEFYSKYSFITAAAKSLLSTSLDTKLINNEIASSGVIWSDDYTENIIEKFYNNLSIIASLDTNDRDFMYAKESLQLNRNSDVSFLFTDFENSIFEVCDQYLNNCFIIDEPNIKELLDKDLIYQGKNTYLTGFNKENIQKDTILETSNEITINNVHLKFFDEVEFELDKNKKIMSFILKNKNSKVLIKSLDEITDWEFIITSLSDGVLDSRSDENLLTGCLTFYQTKLENIKIRSENGHCEDSVNFVSSTGSINNIEINNATSDALDLDFSYLQILKITIENAGNDCLDVSAGNYYINNLELLNCKDKGLSVGEKSYVDIKNLNIKDSDIAIAIKDSSDAIVTNFYGENVKNCVNAYRKKQEFGPVRIKILDRDCKGINEDFIQEGSSYIEK